MARLIRLSATARFRCSWHGKLDWIGFTIARFGSEALAGYTIGIRVIHLALSLLGYGERGATMVGQGWEKRSRSALSQAVWRAAFYTMDCLGIVGLMFCCSPGKLSVCSPTIQTWCPTAWIVFA